MVPVIAVVIIMSIIIGENLICNTNEFAKTVVLDETEEVREIKVDDIIKLAENLSGKELEVDDESDEFKRLVATSQILVVFLDYICIIIIVNTLAKLFGNVEKEGTPFTKENIENLNIINIFAIVLFVFGTPNFSMGLVSVIIISAITYIFKYGYKIQQEVDETL